MDPTQLIAAADAWLASLHPHMAGASVVQLVSVLAISWMGCRAIAGRDDDDPPPPREKTLSEVREILDRAKRRR